jgi:hypothetical protein
MKDVQQKKIKGNKNYNSLNVVFIELNDWHALSESIRSVKYNHIKLK